MLVVVLAACSSSSSTSTATAARAAGASRAAGATTAPSAPPTTAARSAGCDKSAAAGQRTIHITSSGVDRWYLRDVPALKSQSTTPVAMPLVVDVHGYQEGAKIHAAMSGMGAYGDAHGFVTATPNGLGAVPHWDTNLGSADLKFIGDVVDDVERSLCIDTRRVYATGLSQGAFMSSAIACEYADRFAAVAPVAGITANIKGCQPARPVPIITFHGTADRFVAYDGGLGPAALDLPAPDGSGRKLRDVPGVLNAARSPSVPEQLAAWAKRNGCTLTLHTRTIAGDVTLLSYPCPKGREVELYRVTGGGHSWPGSAFSASPVVANVVGKTTMSIDATKLIWAFFQRHSL